VDDHTGTVKVYRVMPRSKPEDYVYTETEVKRYDALEERLTALEKTQGGSVTPEQIQKAVDNYLTENPVQLDEADPTVPDWAKQPNKPSYTADEVGAQPKGDYALRSEIPAVPDHYPLPVASADTLGGVKVGNGLQMDGDVLGVKPEGEWELIEAINVEEDGLTSIARTMHPDGTQYHLSAAKVFAYFFYPLSENAATAVNFLDSANSRIGYVMATIPKSTQTQETYKSTGIFQAKPNAGLYEITSMAGAQGVMMSINAPSNGSFQTTPASKKIAKIEFSRWDNKAIPRGTKIEIWGVRA
jgi:hypothetical protein